MSCLSLSELPEAERGPAPSKLVDFNPLRPLPRQVIRDALTVTCLRLHLSATQTESVIDTAIATYATVTPQPSTARVISDSTRLAYDLARWNGARGPGDAA
jgi:hypothetical protein